MIYRDFDFNEYDVIGSIVMNCRCRFMTHFRKGVLLDSIIFHHSNRQVVLENTVGIGLKMQKGLLMNVIFLNSHIEFVTSFSSSNIVYGLTFTDMNISHIINSGMNDSKPFIIDL